MTVYIGLDRGDRTVAAAEHWLQELVAGLGDQLLACTHLVRTPMPHVAVSIALPDGVPVAFPPPAPEFVESAWAARQAHATGLGGRAVHFVGRDAMTGVLTVAELLAAGPIERVAVLGQAAAPDPATEVETNDFVRPQWMDGRLTLVTQPARGGRLTPFEVARPRGCCDDH